MTVTLPRRRPFKKTMHRIGAAKAAPAGEFDPAASAELDRQAASA